MERVFKLKKDVPDERDFIFKASPILTALPEEYDLRPYDRVTIFDQGSLGSCTANAGCAMKEFIYNRSFQYYFNLSRMYLYYECRALHGWENEDSGAYIRDVMKVLADKGCCTESYFPYKQDTFTNKPSAEADQNATNDYHHIHSYHRILDVESIKASLVEGFPVIFGMDVLESFYSETVARTGIVPDPVPNERNLGGHAVLIMGYKNINGKLHFIVRNSWGIGWGDKGHFYLPVSYFENNAHVYDMWTARY